MIDFIMQLALLAVAGMIVLGFVALVQVAWNWLERSDAERGLTFSQWRRTRG